MTIIEFKTKINENIEFSNSSFSSEAKFFAQENLDRLLTLSSEDLGKLAVI